VALGSCPPRAPTDPDVRALAHPVLQPADSPSTAVPKAIRSSDVDMGSSLDVLGMFPSIGSAGRRFASLHRVLRGEFPCFSSTIKALRLPVARLAALRFLRLAIPRCHSLFSLLSGRVDRPGLELVTRSLRPGLPRKQPDLPSSWGTSMIRLPCSTPTPAGLLAPDRSQCRSMAPGHRTAEAPTIGSFGAQ
jgi:hypothetical protein